MIRILERFQKGSSERTALLEQVKTAQSKSKDSTRFIFEIAAIHIILNGGVRDIMPIRESTYKRLGLR